jgi:hypothetical protein
VTDVTVREIADRICRRGEDTVRLVDRIRKWTDLGLLVPIGKKSPGTGRHRLYAKSSVADALVLSILTDATGLQAFEGPIGQMFKVLRNSLEVAPDGTPRLAKGDGLEKLINSTSGAGTKFLVLGLSRDSRVPPESMSIDAGNLSAAIADSRHESHVVIDLWKLNQRLNLKEHPDG